MKIAIDIDDTLTNTKENQIILWKEYYNDNPKEGFSDQLPKEINEFNIDEYIDIFWDSYREELSFNSSYKQDTSLVIKKLQEDGHQLCIVTSRPKNKYNNLLTNIKKSLKDNNIQIDIIYTDILDKGSFCKEHNFNLLIDDSLNQILNAQKNGLKTILFNENKDYKGLQTTTWKDLYNIIKTLQ